MLSRDIRDLYEHWTPVGIVSHILIKLKNIAPIDLRVIDVFKGKGKYLNELGGVICELPNGNTVKIGSGFSDADRLTYWSESFKIIGQIIEIEYHELTPNGSLREPRYKGIRYDKTEPDTDTPTVAWISE